MYKSKDTSRNGVDFKSDTISCSHNNGSEQLRIGMKILGHSAMLTSLTHLLHSFARLLAHSQACEEIND